VPVDFAVNIIQRKGRALRTLIEPFPVQGPSSGRCAGPTSADLTGFELPVHRLPGRPEGYDLSGTRSLDAGSYLVTIVSTVRARRGSAGSAGSFGFGAAPGPPPGPPSGAPKPRSVLLEDVVVTYAAALAGSLTMTFSAGPAPGCTPLGACGSSGSLTGTIGQNGGRLRLEAQKVVPRALSRAAALAELRAGRMTLFPAAPIQVSLPASATTDAAGGAVCRDAHVLEPTLTGVPQRGALGFSLSLQGGDPLRSRCPGPATVDVLGAGDTIASGRLALRRLGDPRLSLQLSGAGSFAAPSYGGSRRAAMAADLRLVSISVHARRERGFFGLP
jgi:hypothetical protein